MSASKVKKFLDAQADVPQRLRDAMIRTHGGRWPAWRMQFVKRGVSQIVEVATKCQHDRSTDRFIVLRWYWNDRYVGVRWKSYATLREARAHKEQEFRIDAVHVNVGA